MLLAGHACDRFFSKPSARLAWQFHFPLSSRCNHGGISDGAAGAVPGLPPGRGTFLNDVIMLVVAVVTAARGLHVATSDVLGQKLRVLMCQVFLRVGRRCALFAGCEDMLTIQAQTGNNCHAHAIPLICFVVVWVFFSCSCHLCRDISMCSSH